MNDEYYVFSEDLSLPFFSELISVKTHGRVYEEDLKARSNQYCSKALPEKKASGCSSRERSRIETLESKKAYLHVGLQTGI